MSVLGLIKSIAANRESGRLEINSAGTHGTLLFHDGKLVDARLGSLSGFQAVNAAVALRDAEVTFDHVEPASHVSTITPNERVVLSHFFGIEAAEMEEAKNSDEPEIDWNPAPEPVVPLVETRRFSFAFFSSRLAIAVGLALLLGVAAGAVALRSRVNALRQSAAVANAVESQPASVPAVQDEPQPVASAASTSAAATRPEPTERDANADKGDVNVQDLTGEWRIINTVEKTAYKSYGNMQVGFHLTINQNGKEFTAKGEKFSENGQTLPVARRTPIEVKGSIDGDKVIATFYEDGRMRRTNGRFIWKLKDGGDALTGTFVSTAANSSGTSSLTKQ